MRYLGSFTIPSSDGSGTEAGQLTYGGFALGVNPHTQTLYIGGHDWYKQLCEVSIPSAPGQASKILQRCQDVTEDRMPLIDVDTVNLGGTLVWNGRLIVSTYSYYDGDGNATLSHFASGLNLAQTGDLSGPVQVGTEAAATVAGYMGVIPEEWRALLGGPALTGNCCLSIISRTSSGPAVSVFDPDDIGRVSPVPATELLAYPLSNPLAPETSQNLLFNLSTNIKGVAFPAGTRSVLFVGRIGAGTYCYGGGDECGDPADASKGAHMFPYHHQVWAYDANELLAVKQGAKQPWQLRPYATWRLPDIDNSGAATIAGATYDHATRRLYIAEQYGDQPRVHVYEITNGIAQAPSPFAPGPAPTAPAPAAPGNLASTVQGANVALNWTASPSAGVIGYLLEAGSAPGLANLARVPLAGNVTSVSTTAAPGRFFVRVRAGNAAYMLSPPSNEVQLTVGGPSAPTAGPQSFRASVAGNTVVLSWSPPAAGESIADYVIDVGTASGLSNLVAGIPIGAGPTLVVNGVPNGTYYARLRARNMFGTSQPSNEAVFTVGAPLTVPPAPASLVASVGADRTLTLTWVPQAGSAATAYVLEAGTARRASNLAVVALGAVPTLRVPGVPPSTFYVRIRAANAAGLSSPTNDVRVVVP